jgi:hypothetical protein
MYAIAYHCSSPLLCVNLTTWRLVSGIRFARFKIVRWHPLAPDHPAVQNAGMNRRRVIVGLTVLAVVALVAAALWPSNPHPCRATFERARDGMTRDEVIAIVGVPPGDYKTGPHLTLPETPETWVAGAEYWFGDDGELRVRFYDGGATQVRVRGLWHVVKRPTLIDRACERFVQ